MQKLAASLCLALTLANPVYAEEEPHLPPETIWIVFEQDGHQWMVGTLKEYARRTDDNLPGFSHDLGLDTVVKVQFDRKETLTFWACCTTNVWISEKYTGTVTIGKRGWKVSDLLKIKRRKK